MKLMRYLLLAASVFTAAACSSGPASAQPGFPPATVQQPVIKDQCAVWVESSQNALKSVACSGGGGSGTPGGADTQLQYNNAGAFGGISGATSNGATVQLANPVFINPALGTPASGVGTNITGLNASNLSTGTVPDARFPATLPAANGSNLTSLNATNLGSGAVPAARMPALTGDVTTSAGAVATTLATVNGNVGTFGDSTHCANFTVNAKGLITAAAQSTSCPGAGGGSVSVTAAGNNIVINPTPGTGTFTVGTTYPVRAVTTTSDTISCSTDLGKLVTYSNASAIAVTVPQATSTCGAGASFDAQNVGTVGVATFTPTTSTVNGRATLAIPPLKGCTFVSDGTNWQVASCSALANAYIGINFSGVLANSAKFTYKCPIPIILPASLPSSQSVIGTNPAATLAVTLNKNGSSIGSVSFATNGTPTVTFASDVTCAVGDIITAVGPGTADSTGADIGITLVGRQYQ